MYKFMYKLSQKERPEPLERVLSSNDRTLY